MSSGQAGTPNAVGQEAEALPGTNHFLVNRESFSLKTKPSEPSLRGIESES